MQKKTLSVVLPRYAHTKPVLNHVVGFLAQPARQRPVRLTAWVHWAALPGACVRNAVVNVVKKGRVKIDKNIPQNLNVCTFFNTFYNRTQ